MSGPTGEQVSEQLAEIALVALKARAAIGVDAKELARLVADLELATNWVSNEILEKK